MSHPPRTRRLRDRVNLPAEPVELPMHLKPGLMIAALLCVCTLGGCGQKGPLTLPPTKPAPATTATAPAPAASIKPPPPVFASTAALPATATSTAPVVPASAGSSN